MPKFLTEDECFTILQGELPEGVYASDLAKAADPDKRSWVSSELRAWAKLAANAYDSLEAVYDDKFISYASEGGIARWEKDLLFYGGDGTLLLEERRAILLAKVRSRGGLSYPALNALVSGILAPLGFTWDIVTCAGGRGGAWMIDTHCRLDQDTYLAYGDPLRGAVRGAALDCDLDFEAAGITAERLEGIQQAAFTYLVRITNGTLSDGVASFLDLLLTTFEPGRSTHQVVENFTGDMPDVIDGGRFSTTRYFGIIDGGRFGVASEHDVISGGTW